MRSGGKFMRTSWWQRLRDADRKHWPQPRPNRHARCLDAAAAFRRKGRPDRGVMLVEAARDIRKNGGAW